MPKDVFEELRWRGLIHQATDPDLGSRMASTPFTAYCGFDPTASSLTTAHLLQLLGLRRLQVAGHSPIALAGGGTGLVGDPSGRDTERSLLTLEQVEDNLSNIRGQLERLLDFTPGPSSASLINNADWLGKLRLTDFLRDVGKHFSVNMMLTKDSVRQRLEDREQGLSFAEFTYMLLQSYDFLHLFDNYGCRLQMGGSDQWGNITAGIDLIRRMRGEEAFGLTSPLLVGPSGRKMSKSEGGAVWLDPNLTSPYRFYQFWFNTDDAQVVQFLKYFTFLTKERIAGLAEEVSAKPERREAQRALAWELTTLVHGEDQASRAVQASRALFGGEISDLDEATLLEVLEGAPSTTLSRSVLDSEGLPLARLLFQTRLSASTAEAKEHLLSGGVYVNSVRVGESSRRLTADDLVHGKYILLRRGKKAHHLLRIEG